MLRTSLTGLLGSSIPVVNAPMGGQAGPRLAAAVTAGGATGMVGVSPDSDPDAAHRALVEAGPGCGAGLLAWALEGSGARAADALVDALAAASPVLASVSYGAWQRPAARLRAAGVPVATTAGTLAAARDAAAVGVDVLVVRGGEGGGHGRDELATLPLLQRVLDDVDHPCVVAAGGISSARGLAAVLAAGAAGAWLGTALLASPEADVPDATREALIGAEGTDTVYSRVYDVGSAWPREFGGRSLRNRYTDRWRGREDELEADDPALAEVTHAHRSGEVPVVYAGQGTGLLTARRPAAEVVADLGAGAEALLRRWG